MNQDFQVTFCMIKPDATSRNLTGAILQKLEAGGLKLLEGRRLKMDKKLCETFYQDHKSKAFFTSLTQFILSGPVFVMAMGAKNAIAKTRTLIGDTDPKKAPPGSIRALYGESIERNSIHASDSLESAKRELNLFFKLNEF